MMPFTATLLFLCAAALCFTTTAALPKVKTDFHKVQKRQVSQSVVCGAARTIGDCTNGRLQELVNLNDRCDRSSSTNQRYEDDCRRNSEGLFCGGEAEVLAEKFEVDFETTCDSSAICSAACRSLILDARNRLGCCINIYNDSDSFFSRRQYSYTVWSRCGISQVTELCEPSTIDLRIVPVDPTCNSTVFSERSRSIRCRRDYVNSARNTFSDIEECEDFFDLGTSCNANRNRIYCNSLSLSRNFSEANDDCDDTSTCNTRCIETLTNITNTVGCCFMDEYNTTYRYGWLGYEFWTRCNLESPGFCEEYLNDAAVILKASSTAIIFTVTAAVLQFWTAM